MLAALVLAASAAAADPADFTLAVPFTDDSFQFVKIYSHWETMNGKVQPFLTRYCH